MSKSDIPSNFYKLFKSFCKSEFFEELQGDLEEAFDENVVIHGVPKAKNIYRKEVIKMLRPSVIRKINSKYLPKQNHFPMFKNYFKTSYRSLMRNPLSSFINVFGLSVAIGICLVVFAFINRDINTDRFHENKYEVYLATTFVDRDGSLDQYGITPAPLGKMLQEDFTQISKICRIKNSNVVLKYEDKVFNESIIFTDATYLEMFTFPLKWGIAQSLSDVNSIIFSEKMSIKYFGQENPIGQDILIKFGKGSSKTFTITGVAQAFPKAHDIDFEFLINFENLKYALPDYTPNDWKEQLNATLIQVNDASDLYAIEASMDKYLALQNKVKSDWKISSFKFEQLADLHEKKIGEIKKSIAIGYPVEGRIVMPIIGLFMLLLACFNYINIAIVSSTKRLKEIGIRKVIGANKSLVIIQFLAENIFMTVFALLIGFVLGAYVFIPWFVELFFMELELNLLDINLWIFLLMVLLFTGVISGLYPAFYISKFKAVQIFKGSIQFGNKNPLTKLFLGIQLVLSCITIVAGVMFTLNSTYTANRDWGYNAHNTLYAEVPDKPAYDQLHLAISQNPDVLTTAGSKHHVGNSYAKIVIHTPERQYEVLQFAVDANYFETLGLDIMNGRAFKAHYESDKQAIIVNETLVKKMSWETSIGQLFKIDSTLYEVVGVVKDFHTRNFDYQILPTVFRVSPPQEYKFLSMSVRKGKEKEVYKALQEQWLALYPEEPFRGDYQSDVFGYYFDYLKSTSSFMKALSFVAVLLASLGLYGLVTLNVSGRIKEFSIRKVLGAGLDSIALNITKQYSLLFAISLTIGAITSYFLIGYFIDMIFAYHVPMNFVGVTAAVLILLLVLFSVVSTQVLKILKSNPVDGLKEE